MTREKYESLPLATLKELAKARGLKGISTLKKAELIEAMLNEDDKENEILTNGLLFYSQRLQMYLNKGFNCCIELLTRY